MLMSKSEDDLAQTQIHSSNISIIQKYLTNKIAANEITIAMTPYCPTPQHLLHMQEGVNLLVSSRLLVNQNVLDT